MIKITLKTNGNYFAVTCGVCGGDFELEEAKAYLESDTSHEPTHVCKDCIAAGPEGFAERARDRADAFQRNADDLRALADLVASRTVKLPSMAQWELTVDRMYVERSGMTREHIEAHHVDDPKTGTPF